MISRNCWSSLIPALLCFVQATGNLPPHLNEMVGWHHSDFATRSEVISDGIETRNKKSKAPHANPPFQAKEAPFIPPKGVGERVKALA